MISVPQGTVDPNAFPQKIRGVGAKWVTPGWAGGFDKGTQNLGNGFLYYIPIFVEEATIYDRIAIKVVAFAGTLARLGIYSWKDGLPDKLVLDAGTVATDANGVKELVIDQQLERGYYFLAVVANGTPLVEGFDIKHGFFAPVSGYYINFGGERNIVTSLVVGRVGDVAGGLVDPAPAPTIGATAEIAVVELREV